MVARICEALALHGRERVLDVGTGSGYQAAVLSLLGARGRDRRAPAGAGRAGAAEPAPGGFENVRCAWRTERSASQPARRSTRSRSPPRRPSSRGRSTTQLAPRGRLVVPVGSRGGQRLEVIVRSPEGPAVLRSVRAGSCPLVGEEGFPG
jgi:protein-L-isoaspartate(D-aspartate) O-methyltransferase